MKYTDEQINAALRALREVGYACLTDDEKRIIDSI